MYFPPLTEPLSDGVVMLRLPSVEAGDVEAVLSYIDEDQLNGGWLPKVPFRSAKQAVGDWLGAWAGLPGGGSPMFVATIPEAPRFIGVVGFGDRGQGAVEMIYGIAPRWRGRGLGSRAARLGAQWAASLPSVSTVELRIGQDATASQHVAVNAGFVVVGTVSQFVPGTGETFDDLRYVLAEPRAPPRT